MRKQNWIGKYQIFPWKLKDASMTLIENYGIYNINLYHVLNIFKESIEIYFFKNMFLDKPSFHNHTLSSNRYFEVKGFW